MGDFYSHGQSSKGSTLDEDIAPWSEMRKCILM